MVLSTSVTSSSFIKIRNGAWLKMNLKTVVIVAYIPLSCLSIGYLEQFVISRTLTHMEESIAPAAVIPSLGKCRLGLAKREGLLQSKVLFAPDVFQ